MSDSYELHWFPSSDGRHRLPLYLWYPAGAPKGIVQIIHGMREHMGRYHDFAAFLTRQGFLVCGHDQLGHGKAAAGEHDVFGHFGDKDGCRFLLRDCHTASRIVQRHYPGTPLFLLGHSMGSFIARLYILQHAKELTGFLCLGTTGSHPGAHYGRALAEVMGRVRGKKRHGGLVNHVTFSSYWKHFGKNLPKSAWISRDPEVVRRHDEDPFCQPNFSNRGFCDLFTIMTAISDKKWAGRVDQNLPILLASGTQDPVGLYGKGVVEVYERLKLAGVLDVKCKLYPGARHELLNEINKEEVYYDLLQWMEERMPQERRRPGTGSGSS